MAIGLSVSLTACSGSYDSTKLDSNPGTDKNGINTYNNFDTAKSNNQYSSENTDEVENFDSQASNDTLVVGVKSMHGDFIQGFANDSSDVKVRRLLGIEGNNGFSPYVQDENSQWHWNEAILIEEPERVENEDGSMTMTFNIKDDVKWSDGHPLTADDYLFYSLLHSDYNYIAMTGSMEMGEDTLVGYDAFHSGDSKEFEGLEKIDDHSFSITIDSSQLPYFDIQALGRLGYRPIHYIAPNLTVADNGKSLVVKEGYEITKEDKENIKKSIDNRIAKIKEEFDEIYKQKPEEFREKVIYEQELKKRDEK